ncbi:LuxR C-terminal-related transcriptional regulator [Azospirillum sp. ST 5-10]|uniref:LuxR C-terminal-related transcriptional regulator n=1 Tax=unclassified Azospirillum TaxID=2630922 RepID=UPI003F4A1BF8
MSETFAALVAESRIFREGIKALLGKAFTVSLEASGIAEAVAWGVEPDIILLDHVEGYERSSYAALRASYPDAAIVFLLQRASAEQAVEILRIGAQGVLGPNLSADALVLSLQLVLAGQVVVPSVVVEVLHDLHDPHDPHDLHDPHGPGSFEPGDFDGVVTPRERQILEMIVRGHGNKSIGLKLGLREPTVKFYVKNIMRKLNVANRTQIAVWAISHGCGTDIIHSH